MFSFYSYGYPMLQLTIFKVSKKFIHSPPRDLRDELLVYGLLQQADTTTNGLGPKALGSRMRRKWHAKRRKRSKQAGVRAKVKENPCWPALPSILLDSTFSLGNKMDNIRLQRSVQCEFRECCALVFTEMWLSDRVLDIQLDTLTSFRVDRDATLCGQACGGGLCVYIITEWCKDSAQVSGHCSTLVEFMIERCRPFYLSCEFTTALIVAVYIPPDVYTKEAIWELYKAINELQTTHPDRLIIIAGDFNQENLKSRLPKFHQYMDFVTRGTNTLDLVYTNISTSDTHTTSL
ncbi:uncharacterized protein [Narcine bancroftii]|uniref:uncharacterized protein n=1 Tax=Narcine bancroftii TaxID=1343680 RepID=UPI003831164A